MGRWHTDNAEHLQGALLPAYERELAAAKAKGDAETVAAVEAEIGALRQHLGLPVQTATRKASEKRDRKR